MESNKSNWNLGEIANLPRTEKVLKQSGSTTYVHYIQSRYICIREATENQRGILLKVLGKPNSEHLRMVSGLPFCKDDREELFNGRRYFSFPFPSARDVQEVLEILKWNQSLVDQFEAASMHINPDSTFWVNDTTRNMLFQKKPQFLDARDAQLHPATDDANHYRLSIVHFFKGNLNW